MAKTIADLMVETLADAGVERIWGVTGDSLNAMNDSLNRHGGIAWMHTRHEEGAAFSAGAEAAVTGRLSVCAGSCGPGNLHLINGLYDAHRNQVPVLAIAAHIPSAEIGSSYFQETHPTELFRECSHFCELVSDARQMPRMLHRAMSAAVGQRGVAVLVIPGDVALMDAPDGAATRWPGLEPSRSVPSGSEIAELAKLLNGTAKVTLMCGAGCEGAHDAVVALADALQAPIVHSLRGKEHVEWGNAFDVGMTGLIGFSSGFHAMKSCEALLLLGTDFPYRDFYPEGVPIAQVDRNPQALGRRTALTLGIVGDVGAVATALRPLIEPGRSSAWLTTAQAHYREARKDLDALATPRESARPLHPQFVAKTVSALAAEDAVFTADVGTPTVWAARYLTMNGRRRLVGSFNHGSMAGALPQALGAQAAFPERQVVALCGDGGLAMLLGEMLTAVQLNLPVKLVVFDNSVLGFVAMEMKAAGYLDTNVALQNPDFAAMARTMGFGAWRVERSDALEDALRAAFAHPGPALVDVLVASSELAMPPAIKAAQVKGFSLFALRAVMNGRGDELLELAKTNVLR